MPDAETVVNEWAGKVGASLRWLPPQPGDPGMLKLVWNRFQAIIIPRRDVPDPKQQAYEDMRQALYQLSDMIVGGA